MVVLVLAVCARDINEMCLTLGTEIHNVSDQPTWLLEDVKNYQGMLFLVVLQKWDLARQIQFPINMFLVGALPKGAQLSDELPQLWTAVTQDTSSVL